MISQGDGTLYDILEISPNSSMQEIRDAYLRAKEVFGKENSALYTLVTSDDREAVLRKIEYAYQILSDLEKRRDYDRNHSNIHVSENPFDPGEDREIQKQKITSIDRVPPMESSLETDQLLVAPPTDFNAHHSHEISNGTANEQAVRFQRTPPLMQTAPIPNSAVSPDSSTYSKPASAENYPSDVLPTPARPSYRRAVVPELTESLQQAIEVEKDWSGDFLKKIREGYKISIEEMAANTKISKTYLLAIEKEDFKKLPASVYVRGFVSQVAKVLKLPHEKVSQAYLVRFKAISTITESK